jgi:hypothetical protein
MAAYRKPGVTVTQEFTGLIPALAAFALPSVVVGPAYQLVDVDNLGAYSGTTHAYAYASAAGGSIVDLEILAGNEAFPASKKPVSVLLKNATIEVLPAQTSGSVSGDVFTDATVDQFDDVLPGDLVVVTTETGLTVISAQTNGQSTNSAGLTDRLTGTANQFANVKVGDSVVVTGGTNAVAGTYTVVVKISSTVLKLSAAINNGTGPSTNTAYSIMGDRGTVNQGSYRVKTVIDVNTLVLESPMADSPEAGMAYSIHRTVASIELARVSAPTDNGFQASGAAVTLPGSGVLQYQLNSILFPILSGTVYASYRALRTDKAAEVVEYTSISSITAAFGTGQITPANPLPYALSLMAANTVTAFNGLGLDANAVTNEVLSYTAAADVLKLTEMYAISLLSQLPAVHSLFKNHVEQLSAPDAKRERVVLFNSKMPVLSILQAATTTATTIPGARAVVVTQVDGAGVFAAPATLTDATASQFSAVKPGDSVVVQSGANATPGTYTVLSVTDANTLVLNTNFITGAAPAIQYYVSRKDGLGSDGVTFYDRNAQFLSNGAAPGHNITILAGALKGSYKIATVDSEKQVTLAAPVQGVATLQPGLNYQVDRPLTRSEQADAIGGYSASFGSRRCVHVWPDVLQAPVGQDILPIPGYYGAVVLAALTTGLPTQQGFTNLAVSGFLGLDHSTKYFSDAQLNAIASGGTMVLAQDGPNQLLYVRHQLTTDRSAIKFQEYSFTKNVDFVSKFLRGAYISFIGKWNIIDTTIDSLKGTGQSAVSFLKERTRLPRIGGVIRGGTIASLKESLDQIDTVEIRFVLNMPIPLNQIDITVQV